MASLKDLRNRISSVKATRKITKAMQMVAAAKLRRAQETATAARPYAQRMDTVLANLNKAAVDKQGASKLLVGTGAQDTHLLLVMTAERGLCGAFNSNIARLARKDLMRLQKDGKTVRILCVGKKGADVLRREFSKQIVDVIELRGVKTIGYANAEAIAKAVLDLFETQGFDICTMYYAEFKSVISQVPTGLQLIPARLPDEATMDDTSEVSTAYDYEPDEDEILGYLLARNIKTQIFRGLLENSASEQGSRMTAMDNATRNAGEMIDKLTLTYNRQRQAQITKELIEIISGAEAL